MTGSGRASQIGVEYTYYSVICRSVEKVQIATGKR